MPRALGTKSHNYVIKLYEYFEQESQNGGPLLPLTRVAQRVAAALGLSPRTVTKALQKKHGAEQASTKPEECFSTDSEDDLIPLKQCKLSAAHRDINKDDRNKNRINTRLENKCPPGSNKIANTDYKRHAYFAVEYSGTDERDTKQLTKSKSQKSTKSNKSKTNKTFSANDSQIDLGLLNSLTTTKPWSNTAVLQENVMSPTSPNITSDLSTTMDDSIDLDALNALEQPIILEPRDIFTTDQLIPKKQDKKIEINNSETHLDEDDIDCFTIIKGQTVSDDNMDKPSSNKTKLLVAQKAPKKTNNENLHTVQKSIAKADFKVGRLKVSGVASDNETDESEEDEINYLVSKSHLRTAKLT